jgi:Clostripain family
MRRREFCRYVAIGSACCFGVETLQPRSAEPAQFLCPKTKQKWVVLYWMPYDNDLSHFGEPIIQMLRNESPSPHISVVVQSDYWGDRTMRRRQISDGKIYEIPLTKEDSSDASNLSAYLNWAHQTFDADHWAVIVVGHGGKINEISPDDHTQNDGQRTWMKVDQFAAAVSRFNQKTGDRVELLFLQNCTKSTLEVIYETRNCARYTLASQFILGAPNYYYSGFLQHLKDSGQGEKEAAIAIMNSEQPNMYGTLSLIDNQAIKLIPDRLSTLLDIALEGNQDGVNLAEVVTYHYAQEKHCDLLSLMTAILGQKIMTINDSLNSLIF